MFSDHLKVISHWVVISALTAAGCSDLTESSSAGSGKEAGRPDQEGWNATVFFTTNGVIEAELHARHMMRWNGQKMTTFGQGLRVEFYEKGVHNATLTSDSGEVRGHTNNLTAIGNVVIVSDSGLTMRTEKIYWDDQKQKIIADGFVTMTSDEDTLNGYEFESNRDLTNWKMKNAFGRSARDIDLRTGTVKPRDERTARQDAEMEKEMKNALKDIEQ